MSWPGPKQAQLKLVQLPGLQKFLGINAQGFAHSGQLHLIVPCGKAYAGIASVSYVRREEHVTDDACGALLVDEASSRLSIVLYELAN